MVQVQGSAILEMTDGSRMAIGFADGTDYSFVGFSKDCYSAKGNKSLSKYFSENPDALGRCVAKNNRFVFFKERATDKPIGSLGVPVIANQSIATDKSQLPPGALGLICTQLPASSQKGEAKLEQLTRVVLDQDTGRAIKGPGRVDVFMGTGEEGQKKANMVYAEGSLYYLLLK